MIRCVTNPRLRNRRYELRRRRYPVVRDDTMDACHDATSRMLAALRGDLGAGERVEFERHLASCASCAKEMDSLQQAWLALDDAAAAAPPTSLRDAVLSRVAAAREADAKRVQWTSVLKSLLPGLAAALVSLFLAVPDPDCRTPLGIACCGAVWVALYGTAFAVFIATRRGSIGRALVARGLAAATGGLLLANACPMGSGGVAGALFPAARSWAITSSAGAFAVGFFLVAVAVSAAVVLVPPRKSGMGPALATAALSIALLAPALYLGSSVLALSGLVALLAGAAAGALAPSLLDAVLRGRTAEAV